MSAMTCDVGDVARWRDYFVILSGARAERSEASA